MTILIHPVHRKLAEIIYMSTRGGVTEIDSVELRRILQLLRQNLALVQQIDGLKQLSLEAYCLGDMAWVQEIDEQLADIEIEAEKEAFSQ